MKVIKIGYLLVAAPLLATVLFAFIELIEPSLRSILGIAQATERSPVPDSVGYILFFFIFLFFHLVFLGAVWVLGRFGYQKENRNKLIFIYSALTTLLAALVFHAPETGDLFYQSVLVMGLLVGIPICVSEIISENVVLPKTE